MSSFTVPPSKSAAHAQLQAHVLAHDGLERVVAAAATVGHVAPADKRHGLADHDAGRFVVQRHQVRRGQDVGAALALQCVGQRFHVEDLADTWKVDGAVDHADLQAIREARPAWCGHRY